MREYRSLVRLYGIRACTRRRKDLKKLYFIAEKALKNLEERRLCLLYDIILDFTRLEAYLDKMEEILRDDPEENNSTPPECYTGISK